MDEFTKQPSEKFNITIDFVNVLSTETISSYTLKIINNGIIITTGDIIDSSSNTTTTVVIRVKNGTSGQDYIITTLITTNSGNIYEKDVKMEVVNT